MATGWLYPPDVVGARPGCGANQLRHAPKPDSTREYLPVQRGSTGLVLDASDWRDNGARHPWGAVVGAGSLVLAAGAVAGGIVSGPMTGLGTALLLIACTYVGIVGLLFVATRCEVVATGGDSAMAGAVHNGTPTEAHASPQDDPLLSPPALAAALFAPGPAS